MVRARATKAGDKITAVRAPAAASRARVPTIAAPPTPASARAAAEEIAPQPVSLRRRDHAHEHVAGALPVERLIDEARDVREDFDRGHEPELHAVQRARLDRVGKGVGTAGIAERTGGQTNGADETELSEQVRAEEWGQARMALR